LASSRELRALAAERTKGLSCSVRVWGQYGAQDTTLTQFDAHRDTLVFLHIQKTGGSYFNWRLAYWEKDRVGCRCAPPPASGSRRGRCVIRSAYGSAHSHVRPETSSRFPATHTARRRIANGVCSWRRGGFVETSMTADGAVGGRGDRTRAGGAMSTASRSHTHPRMFVCSRANEQTGSHGAPSVHLPTPLPRVRPVLLPPALCW